MSSRGGRFRQSVANFRVPGENRGRTPAEIASKKLPLRQLKDTGFKGYLANMIQVATHSNRLLLLLLLLHKILRGVVFICCAGSIRSLFFFDIKTVVLRLCIFA